MGMNLQSMSRVVVLLVLIASGTSCKGSDPSHAKALHRLKELEAKLFGAPASEADRVTPKPRPAPPTASLREESYALPSSSIARWAWTTAVLMLARAPESEFAIAMRPKRFRPMMWGAVALSRSERGRGLDQFA